MTPPFSPRLTIIVLLLAGLVRGAQAQTPVPVPTAPPQGELLLLPDAVFDGSTRHQGWAVLVRGTRIAWAGPVAAAPTTGATRRVSLSGTTLMPGLIEGHSHLLLHAYNETPWNDQVLREPLAYRVARAVAPRTIEVV